MIEGHGKQGSTIGVGAQEMLTYLAWRAGAAMAQAAPRRVAYQTASLAGSASYFTWPRAHRATTRNFDRVLAGRSRATRRRVARRSLANYGQYLVDFARLSRGEPLPPIETNGHVARLKSVLDEGNGAILATTHFGNWDAAAVLLANEGIPVTAVADRFGNERLDRAVLGAREAAGVEIAVRGEARKMVRSLKDGGVLAMVVDRPAPGDGVAIDFFGARCQVPGGAARLALRTGAPVVAAACFRVTQEEPDLAIWADWDIPSPPVESDDPVQKLTQSIYAAHEAIIRRRPGQWYMFREMWPSAAEAP